jgi:O-antigen/teichoic acid export membrane protein
VNNLLALLRTQTATVGATRVVGILLSLAVASLAAHTLEPAGFGAYTFVIAVVTVLAIPISFGLRQTVVRETAYAIAEDDAAGSRGIVRWALKAASLAALIGALLVAGWAYLGVDSAMRRELVVGAVALLLIPVPQILAGLLQGRGRIVSSQLPEFIVRPLVVAILFLAYRVLSGEHLVFVMVGLFAVGVLAEGLASVMLLAMRRAPSAAVERPAVDSRALTLSTLSFSAIAGVQVVNSNLDIFLLRALAGEIEVGLYRSASALSALATFALLIINTVTLPRIAALHRRNDYARLQALVVRGARVIAAASLVGGAVLILGGKLLLSLLFGPEFAVAYPALAILTAGQLANAFFGQVANILNMTGNERLTLVGVGISVIANAALNVVLIPRYGIEGAAIATASSLFLWNLFLAIGLKRRTGLRSTAF